MSRTRSWILVGFALLAACPAGAAERRTARSKRPPPRKAVPARLTAEAVNNSNLASRVGPGSRGAAVLRAQILLARAHFSCGEIDGRYGTNLRAAIAAFQKARKLTPTGVVDAATWKALAGDAAPALTSVAIAPEDVAGPFAPVPEEMSEKAKLTALSYAAPLEGLAEKYHASPALLIGLNPGASFGQAGESILVPNSVVPAPAPAARVVVSKKESSVTAFDAAGEVLAWYPATMGSSHDPLPIGKWKIQGVSRNPSFHYNPKLFWDAESDDVKARIPPGPNNPVGVAWIDLSKPHYGIHGTPEPARVGKTQSHGCIRLTNWDVWELAQMVSPGTLALLEE